ncbi:hypothetical protein [Methylobacterium sp. WSM2598]|uniref:hypothetical protein n=1 Tax=Methylobacterium sp. WSM2598 TaxID=398261 RepID=UPI000378AADB|nr:hypothetical protein [Methylobacterium sp. WSM2598]
MQDRCGPTPVTIRLGDRTITASVRAVGGTLDLPLWPDGPPRRLRQIVLDLGAAGAPVELWLDEAAAAGLSGGPSRS